MGNPRKMLCPPLLSGQLLAALLLVLAGCTAVPMADFVRKDASVGAPSASNTEQAAEESPKPKPSQPSPRTFPEAICAYLKCLHCPPTGAAAGSEKAEKSDSKGKENNREEKAPPTKGEQAKGENQSQEKDKDKEETKPTEEKEKEEKGKVEEKGKEAEEAWYSAHAQATIVTQSHDHFHSPYIGTNSLLPVEPSATSVTGTIFLDIRLWECGSYTGELVFNPEMAGGKGFSNASGIAGFPNGEITRVGVVEPTPYIARLFVRQTCGLGGEQEKVEDEANQLAGKRDIDRITLTVGKFSATDLADDNRYSHDPRTQFLPWSIMYNGAWDYPANVRGYDYGVGIDFNQKYWALRYGVWAEPKFANSAPLDQHIGKANGHVIEWEGRYSVYEHPGKLRLLAYLNHAHMGDYREALGLMPVNPDVTLTRSYRYKYGFGLSWDQELTKDLGVFARLGWNDGHTESWAFTAIDRLAEIGLLLNGRCWCRPRDQVGLAVDVNGISRDHSAYLAAGGLDFIIGDGKLRYGSEDILDVFYNLEVHKGINATLDFQEVWNPAYNRDRGPVSIVSGRVHFEF